MNNRDSYKELDNDNLKDLIKTDIEGIRKDSNLALELRKNINNSKDFFKNYSFDNLNIAFSPEDVEYISRKDNIFSIHSADNLAVYLYISKKCNKILGFDQGYFIGKCLYSLLHEDDVEKVSKTHDRVLAGKNILTNYRIMTSFNNDGDNYIKLSSYIKKVDNIIVTYLKPIKEGSGYNLTKKNHNGIGHTKKLEVLRSRKPYLNNIKVF